MEDDYQDLYLKLGRASSRIPSRIPARFEGTLNGGGKFVRYSDVASGSPEKPMPPQARRSKILDLTGDRLGSDSQNNLIRQVEKLDGIEDIRPILAGL
jgi:hypothetical protein